MIEFQKKKLENYSTEFQNAIYHSIKLSEIITYISATRYKRSMHLKILNIKRK